MEAPINSYPHLAGNKNTPALSDLFIFKVVEKIYPVCTAKNILGKISLPYINRLHRFMY